MRELGNLSIPDIHERVRIVVAKADVAITKYVFHIINEVKISFFSMPRLDLI